MLRRQLTAWTLLISFVAMAVSGVLMLLVDRPSFTIRLHPVHKVFGIVMVLAALSHLGLNVRTALAYLKERRVQLAAAVLVALLTVACAAVLWRTLPEAESRRLDEAAAALEK